MVESGAPAAGHKVDHVPAEEPASMTDRVQLAVWRQTILLLKYLNSLFEFWKFVSEHREMKFFDFM